MTCFQVSKRYYIWVFYLFIFRFAETTTDFVLVPQDIFFITLFFFFLYFQWAFQRAMIYHEFTCNTEGFGSIFLFVFLYFGGWGVRDGKNISNNHFDSVKKISLNKLSLNLNQLSLFKTPDMSKLYFRRTAIFHLPR